MQHLCLEHKLPSPPLGRLVRFFKSALLTVGLLSLTALSQAQISVLTQHNDNARTGANLQETILNTSNVNSATFGRLFVRHFKGELYAQPLVVSNVNVAGVTGKKNLVIVATMANELIAFDGDDPTASKPYWTQFFGLPIPRAEISCADITKQIGITSTPVVDPATNTLYVLSRNISADANARYDQWIHAIDITTGKEKPNSPRRIPRISYDVRAFNFTIQAQRPALTLSNGVVYVAWASHCDWGGYSGWIMGFDAKNLLYKTSFATTLSDLNKGWGGIWMSGQGLTVDTAGNLYCVTGNGQFTFNADMSKMKDWGMCYLKFGIDSKGRISVKDYFAPSDRDAWNAADLDLGSAGAMMIPETNLILGGSKTGILYLLNTDNMGQFVQSAKDGNAYEALPATTGEIHGAPVYYNSPVLGRTVFVWGDNDVLKGFSFTRDQKLAAEPIGRSVDGAPDPGGILSISSNANQDGTGIVWANRRQSGNQLSGVLQAYDADTLIDDGSGQPKFNLLWDSEQVSSRDSLGNFAKFTPPTIANGKVYMATFGTDATAIGTGGLAVYGLLPTTAPATPATLIAKPGNSQVELDWPVSPGAYRYFVYKGTDPANLSVIANEVLAPTGATMGTYLDNDVTNGTTYYYQVSAVNPAGESAPTNTVNATPNSLLSLIAVADSFVRTGTDANRKFGTDPLLNVSPTETLYVRFDLTQFRGSAVTTAYLQLYASAGSNVNSVYEVADNTWKEDTITANNAPPLGAKISSNVTTLGSGYTSWDITALVRKYKDSGLKFLNLAVKRDTANTVADVFNSRDLGVNPPKITVVVPDYPNYPNGFGNSESMVLNGLTTVAGSNLRLTDYLPGTASSAFFDRKVDITKFKTRFVYNPTKATAEGMTFCIQASDPTVVGNSGAGLGYQYLVDRSVAFKVDIFNNVGEGDSSIGIFTNGKLPTVPSTNLVNTPINFKWGHTYQFDIAYDGWNFNVTIKDLVTGRYTSSKFTVNIPSIIGGNTAYVGFTASTGVLVSRQDVTSWTMSK